MSESKSVYISYLVRYVIDSYSAEINMKKILILALFLFSLPSYSNSLINHHSPYLALHGNDPVDWVEWGEPAIEKARKENKLLFISVGYFACHWCHVMQRESFSDKAIAKKLNKNYVSVKVDRELSPVLDKHLIEFVQVTNGTAGWPLNVFVTPEGYSLVGMTYLPAKNFSGVLDQLDDKWGKDKINLSKRAKEMSANLAAMLNEQEQALDTSMKLFKSKFLDTAMQYADHLNGGFGERMKFPQIPQLWALLKVNREHKNEDAHDFLELTFDQIISQGLHDEVAGGFYRYTTDPDWETPHFEKMIYTNALMPLVLFDAADIYNKVEYRETAIETLKYLQNEMRGSSNAFISSLSAVDDKNVEGGYYLWQQSELQQLLSSEELAIANAHWNMQRPHEHPTGNLPRQKLTIKEVAKEMSKPVDEIKNKVAIIKQKLKTHRNKTRVIPRDTKLLAGMNGLALTAFAKALSHDKSFQQSGDKLSKFLINLWNGEILRRSAANNKSGGLYDYAAVSWGLLHWGAANNDKNATNAGLDIARKAWDKFYKDGYWLEDSNSLLPSNKKLAHITDSAIISPEALLLEASLISKDAALIKKAKEVKNIVTRALEIDLLSYASMLSIKE